MNPISLAQRLPARIRQWVYDVLGAGSAVALVFPEVLPEGVWSRVIALAAALGFGIARVNVSKP